MTETLALSTLSHDELMAQLLACRRERARLDAWEMKLLAALSAEPVPAHEKQYVRDEVASALRLSSSYVYGRFELADRVTALPATAKALGEATISLEHARAIAEATLGMEGATLQAFENSVLPYAQTHDAYDTRRKVRRELQKHDPFTAEQRYEMGLAQRAVWSKKSDTDGLWFVGAQLPMAGAAELMHALSFMAERVGESDVRTKPQRMADALVQLGREVLAGSCSHCERPARPLGAAVNVTVAMSTLLGLDEQPGELNGEVIPASAARILAAEQDATWRRLLTDERGALLDYGRRTYRPPASLRDHVVARDRTCRFPGCRRRAASCDIDHVLAWEDGGTTDASNLIALCPRHHHLKHEAGGRWQVTLLPDGSTAWTTPTDVTIAVPAASYPIDRTSKAIEAIDSVAARGVVVATDNHPVGVVGEYDWSLTYDEPDLMQWLLPNARVVERNDEPPF